MFQNSGLSLEQAPPIEVVLRFFLNGAIFAILGGIFLFLFNSNIFDIASKEALIVVHSYTIGFALSFMLGALFQMLPVIGGVAIRSPFILALRSQYLLTFGTMLLLSYFYSGSLFLLIAGAGAIYIGVLIAIVPMSYYLLKSRVEHPSTKGMSYAIYILVFILFTSLLLLVARGGINIELNYLLIKKSHIIFGLIGWISLLIISVNFQVIEMFYVTKAYPKWYMKYTPKIIFILAIALFLAALIDINLWIVVIFLAILLIFHSILSLKRILNRKRKIKEPTSYFWIISFVSLLFSSFITILLQFVDSGFLTILDAIFFYLFFSSAILAMSLKIVPFLVWFHLNAKGYFEAPLMHEVISPKIGFNLLYLFIASAIFLIISSIFTSFVYLASIFTLFVYIILFIAIYSSWHKYIKVIREGRQFKLS